MANKKIQDDQLRSVAFYRASEDKKGKPQDVRLYRPYKDYSCFTIPDLLISSVFSDRFDLVILHDPYDGCLLVNLQDGVDDRVTSLPCKLHSKS